MAEAEKASIVGPVAFLGVFLCFCLVTAPLALSVALAKRGAPPRPALLLLVLVVAVATGAFFLLPRTFYGPAGSSRENERRPRPAIARTAPLWALAALILLHSESTIASLITALLAGLMPGMAVAVMVNLAVPARRRAMLARYRSRRPGRTRSELFYRRQH